MVYSIKANIPENQINKTITYFDLKMEPNQNQGISLTVNNSSDKKTTLLISPNVAITNQKCEKINNRKTNYNSMNVVSIILFVTCNPVKNKTHS